MKIYEYQAKDLFRAYSIPVPRGRAVKSVDEAVKAAADVGFPAVVKAQVHAGARGKAGGIQKVSTADEARDVAARLLGSRLVTEQTGPAGRVVDWLLIEEAVPIAREIYVGLTVDRKEACLVLLAGHGGVDVEGRAGDIAVERIDPGVGLRPFQSSRVGFSLGLDAQLVRRFSSTAASLYRLFVEKDCSHAEINPLVVTESGGLMALDAKINFDDNALYRHHDIADLKDPSQDDPLETEAGKYSLNYIKLTGNVGCMVNGAGLAMATMDLIKLVGAEPANFLDVGGGATSEMVRQGMRILVADPDVRAIFINIFGGILRCDVLARGVTEAARELQIDVPVVVRMEGTNVEAGRAILRESGLSFMPVATMKDAALKLAELLKQQQ